MSWNFMLFLIIATIIVSAVASGTIASKKGYSYNLFAVLGLFLPIIGPIVAALVKDKNADNSAALLNYKKLLDEGAITQAEFDAKKKELLG